MKRPTEMNRILKAFFFCVLLSFCLMFAAMGFFKVQSNSEYALNGKKPDYVTIENVFSGNVKIFQ